MIDPALNSSTCADCGVSSQSVEQITTTSNTNDDVSVFPGSSTLYTFPGTSCKRKSGCWADNGRAPTKNPNAIRSSEGQFMRSPVVVSRTMTSLIIRAQPQPSGAANSPTHCETSLTLITQFRPVRPLTISGCRAPRVLLGRRPRNTSEANIFNRSEPIERLDVIETQTGHAPRHGFSAPGKRITASSTGSSCRLGID